MRIALKMLPFVVMVGLISCKKEVYPTNGETIFRTGRNNHGMAVLDKKGSQITIFKSCQACHGKNGDRMTKCDIRFSRLTEASRHTVPYTDSLIVRFLDKDLKSDGSVARTGVKWRMGEEDKKDLIQFLKTL